MRLPEFTAEASIYKSTKHYSMVPSGASVREGAVVEPALAYPYQFCEPCEGGQRYCVRGLWKRVCEYEPIPPINPYGEPWTTGAQGHLRCHMEDVTVREWTEPCPIMIHPINVAV